MIDRVVDQRAVVLGSLPPEGRDIDLLVVSADEAAVAARLRDDGFRRSGREFVSFRGCSPCAVELVPAATLNVRASELRSLFSDGVPLEGLVNVVEPAPHHVLLILARKLGRTQALSPKQRRRVDRALTQNPNAWEVGRARAELWRAGRALERLRVLHRDGTRRVHTLRLRRPRRARVIALSACDAATAAAQAELLRQTLAPLGFDVGVERPPHDERVHGGAAVTALPAALALWRPILRDAGRGRILVFVRYTLDTAVSIRSRYGGGIDVALAIRLLRVLSPAPVRAYLLETAGGADAAAYRAGADVFGARRIDGTRPREELCEELASDAWESLRRPRVRRGRRR
jgi:hypothetical protein